MANIRDLFLLDPDIVFLNHGSFGACPRPVFETYQGWQRELERQPVAFLGRRAEDLLRVSRTALAAYLNASADDLVYFPNPTTAVNMALRALRLEPGDEVLTTDNEYGALERAWNVRCREAGARLIRRRLDLASPEALVEDFWAAVTPATRAIFISHITSATALILPVAEICRRARAAGIVTIVDGAHAPGQIPLDLAALDADVYVGAGHKWLCGPKGVAFLHAQPTAQAWLRPLIVSWGWGDDVYTPEPGMGETEFIRWHQWQGTRDLAAYLTLPAALAFQTEHDWQHRSAAAHDLLMDALTAISALTGLPPFAAPIERWHAQLGVARLPGHVDVGRLKTLLYDIHRIEAPVHRWDDQPLIRVSCQAYNSEADIAALVAALRVEIGVTA
ncbi:MAG TPA: aminotransferase class V-fold PLP-dependent enzyme [Anaerolineales bacterium]|nr:aminotransferase class V-fold PLP-dependent enzyme [Anaerolineales bacterium]